MDELIKQEPQSVTEQFENTGSQIYASFNPENREDKIKVYNAMQDTDHQLGDFVGKTIKMTNFIAHTCKMPDMNTGEIYETIRSIVIDEKGESYSTCSPSVKNAFTAIFALVGHPITWESPLEIEILQKKGKGQFKFLTVKIKK